MIRIDGSRGEGGGQVLRSALALSLLTRQPFEIVRIRANRKKPGLAPQHLKAVTAAATVGEARVEGAHQGSESLVFVPSAIHPGRYRFDIGTAGSTSLVLQTILLPLAFAGGGSHLEITGGTHVPMSPCFHYLELQWIPSLRLAGLRCDLTMERAGFYPPGGGLISAVVEPLKSLNPLSLLDRGRAEKVLFLSAVANLDSSIAERQTHQAMERLSDLPTEIDSRIFSMPAMSKGTMFLILGEFENSRCCYTALGERGKPAERVADEAVDAFRCFLETDGAIDQYLADQLLLPLVFASGRSELRTAKVTRHLLTNADLIRQFLPANIEVEGELGEPGVVRIEGLGKFATNKCR